MLKYKVSAVIKLNENCDDKEMWELHGYKKKMPYVSPDGVIAYKITAGLYIFYITHAVYEKGISVGIIEPMTDNTRVINFDDILRMRGMICCYRIGYALEHSTIEYLTSELERTNSEDKIVKITHYSCDWWSDGKCLEEPFLTHVAEVVVDLENRKIIKNTADKTAPFHNSRCISVFRQVNTYEDLLDALVSEQDRLCCNSRHIIDKFADAQFYSTDYFLTRQDKYEFTYM